MINISELSSDEDIDTLEENFKNIKEEINKSINKVKKYPIPTPMTRNYYPNLHHKIYNMKK